MQRKKAPKKYVDVYATQAEFLQNDLLRSAKLGSWQKKAATEDGRSCFSFRYFQLFQGVLFLYQQPLFFLVFACMKGELAACLAPEVAAISLTHSTHTQSIEGRAPRFPCWTSGSSRLHPLLFNRANVSIHSE